MDNYTIFTKTAKGLGETLGKTKNLSREQRKILKEIDGKASLGDVIAQIGTDEPKLQAAIAKLLADDYIREFGSSAPPEARAAGDTVFGLTMPAKIEAANSQLTIGDFFRAMEQPQSQGASLDFRNLPQVDDAAARLSLENAVAQVEQTRRAIEEEAQRITRQVQQQAADAARLQAEQQSRRAAEEAARRAAEEQARKEVEAKAAREAELARQQAVEQARLKAEEQARREVREAGEAQARAKKAADDQARREAEALAMREAQAKAEAERQARERAEAEARMAAEERARKEEQERQAQEQARIEAEQAQQEARRAAEEAARREAEERARQDAAERERQAAEDTARRAVEEQARKEAQEAARIAAEARALEEAQAAQERARKEAEEQMQREAEDLVRRQAEEAARRLADEQAKKEAQEQARMKAREAARRVAEELARREAEAQAKAEAERQAREHAEEEVRLAAEERTRREAEDQARKLAEEEARRAAEEQMRLQAQEQARLAAEEQARRDAEALAKKAEQERARQEAEEAARLKAEEKARQKAEEKARKDAEAQAKQEAREQARREAEEKARQEAAQKAQLAAEAKAIKEAEQQARHAAKEQARQAGAEAARLKAEEAARVKAEKAAEKQAQREARDAEKAAASSGNGASLVMLPANIGKLARLGALALVVVAAVGVGLLHVVPFNGRLAQLEQAATAQFGQPVKVGSLKLALLPTPQWRLQQVAIGNEGQITVREVDVRVALGSVFSDAMQFKSVTLVSPVVNDEGMGWLLFGQAQNPAWQSASINATDLQLRSRHVRLPTFTASAELGEDGSWRKLVLDAAGSSTRLDLQRADATVRFELTASGLVLPFGGTQAFDTFNASGKVMPDALEVSKFTAVLYDGTVSGNGMLGWRDGWSLKGEAQARQIALSRLMPALLQSGAMDGSFRYTMQADAAGKLFASPQARGSFSIGNGMLVGVDLASQVMGQAGSGRSAFNEMSGEFALVGGKVQVSRMRMSAGLLSATGDATADANDKLDGRFAVDLRTASRQAHANLNLSGTLASPRFSR
ncbi:hypothetical protein [Janthinobacterium sp. 17J80-10]|uniref:hypothetical protein n=1 Tax=Janthinobacterium sp. 17J80-10 TaxID=2497863 RepID=UPI00100545F0|nr:hypothetical protein [Janthinobacterium sp. 17J80-10]QAU32990.1 hypothetical protein EKL02_01715 [Janthinobacterium sp. 17J80-10]